MTVEKALEIIDAAIENKQNKKNGFLDPNMTWNQGIGNVSELANGLALVMERGIEWFRAIKKQLQIKKQTRCRHQKKFHDIDPDGKKYCVSCNQDL